MIKFLWLKNNTRFWTKNFTDDLSNRQVREEDEQIRKKKCSYGLVMFKMYVLNQYFISAFTGMICLIQLIVSLKEQSENKRICFSMLYFCLNTTIASIIMYAVFFSYVVLRNARFSAFFRILDYGSYAGLLYTWISLVESFHKNPNLSGEEDKLYIIGKTASIVGGTVMCYVSVRCMNDFYIIADADNIVCYRICLMIFTITVLFAALYTVMKTQRSILDRYIKKYLYITAGLLALYFCARFEMEFHVSIMEAVRCGSSQQNGWIFTALHICTGIYIYQITFNRKRVCLPKMQETIPTDTERQMSEPFLSASFEPEVIPEGPVNLNESDEDNYAENYVENNEENNEENNTSGLTEINCDTPILIKECTEELMEQKMMILKREYLLTERETEVAKLVYEGFHNKDIANKLFISPNTVKCHIHNIFAKTESESRIELIHLINDIR